MSDHFAGLTRRVNAFNHDRSTAEELSHLVEEVRDGGDAADAIIELALASSYSEFDEEQLAGDTDYRFIAEMFVSEEDDVLDEMLFEASDPDEHDSGDDIDEDEIDRLIDELDEEDELNLGENSVAGLDPLTMLIL